MRVLAQIVPGPSWVPGHAVWDQGAAVRDHLSYMRDQYDAGVLLIGGPLRDGMAGMALIEVTDLDAALDFATADPAVEAGVLVYELAEVIPYFDAWSGVRSGGTSREPATRASR